MKRSVIVLGVIFGAGNFGMGPDAWEKALERARAEGKTVLAYFYDLTCLQCRRYARQTVDNPFLAPVLRHFVVVKLDIRERKALLKELLPHWVNIRPILVLVSPDGKVNDSVIGHLNARAFATYLKGFLQGRTTEAVERKLKEKPNDLLTLYKAAVWFLELGDGERGLPIAERVLKLDPEGKKGFHAPMRVHLGLFYVIHRVREAPRALKEFHEVIRRFPETKAAEEARFYLAATYLALGNDKEAREWLKAVLRESRSKTLRKYAKRLLKFLDTEPPADMRRGEEPFLKHRGEK